MMYALGNVQEEQRADPEFRIPPGSIRENLEPGDLAEILLLSERISEPAWVQVVEVLGPGLYAGLLRSGASVEFGAEHVADVVPLEDLPPPSMGASEPFEVLRRAPPPRPPDPFEVLRRPPPRRPSPFEVLRRPPPPPVREPEPVPAPPPAPKKGFFERFNVFRRKPKVEVEPIPAAERRQAPPPRGPFPELPAPVEVRTYESAPPPPIVPPERPSTALVPSSEAVVPEPQPSSLIVPGPRAPSALAPDAFTMLVPLDQPASRAGMVIPRASDLPASASPNVFDILAPAPGGLAPMGPSSAFDILAPQPKSGGLAPAAPTSAFDILVPSEDPTSLAPLESRPGGMSVFDVLAPDPGVIAPYDPGALDPFTMVALPPAPASSPERDTEDWIRARGEEFDAVVDSRKKEKPRKVQAPPPPPWSRKGKKWIMPSPRDLVPWLEGVFDMERLWESVRKDRLLDDFRQMVIEQEETGESAFIPYETIAYSYADWAENVAEWLDIPKEVISPLLEEKYRQEERDEDWSDTEGELYAFFAEYYDVVNEAFALVQPRDIPGRIIVEHWEDQIVIGYWEGLSEEDRRRIEREEQVIEEEKAAAKDARKKALRKIWGRMPTVEELRPFIEDKFDVDAIWKEVRRERKKKAFKEELEDRDSASISLEPVATFGPMFYDELFFYFSLPPEILTLYLDRNPKLEKELREEVLDDFIERITQAFDETKPRDIPGEIGVGDTYDGRDWFLLYLEQAEVDPD